MITGNHYKHVDPEYINEMAGGEDDFIISVIDIYLEAVPESTRNLTRAAADADYEQIFFWTHKLRGSFNFIGGKDLILTLDKIDELCKGQENLPAVRELVAKIAAISEEIITELNEILIEVKKGEG